MLQVTGESGGGGGDGGGARAFRSLKNLSIVAGNGRVPVLPPSVTSLTLIGGYGTRFEPNAATAAFLAAADGLDSQVNITNEFWRSWR